ncbi:MAG TPA: L,D-transpeptidase family protein [Solirubrobacteraceae bacterium]|nr:L,D-transpeptidase family protein [Solirubrobacteraceae bacterium]
MPVLVAVPFIVIGGGAALVAVSKPSIKLDAKSLAQVSLPLGGGKITEVVAVGGREQQVVPVKLEGRQVLPAKLIPAGERISVDATIRRPGWISWLTGKTEHVTVTETTPVANLTSSFLTRKRGQPVEVDLDAPVAAAGYGALGSHVAASPLPRPQRTLDLKESATAGTADVTVAARTWEVPTVNQITWFPAGTRATAVANPDPGTKITPNTKITLTFSKPVGKVLGKAMPPVSPRTAGSWQKLNSHTIEFVPQGYGYGLGADVRVSLPADVSLVGGHEQGSDPVGQWTVPNGSTLALQQLLAQLGYLPVNFTPSTGGADIASTPAAEEAAIVNPPQGTFGWAYPDTPAQLKTLWSPTSYTEITKGAVMSFEEDHGLPTDGIAGPDVWKALINAAVKGQKSTFGYTFVMVSETSPEMIHVWHSGKIVVHGLVNTGIAAAPTALGTYAVYEHIPVGTMSGKNPDGSAYHDPGIPDISYFNGGDALHGFIRASYGFPQSLGCVEMPYSEAGDVYPYTPIGTIVNLTA